MKNILIIGGTRNMGHSLALRLLEDGHHLTILNRGIDPDTLPDSIHRLRADRTDPNQMRRALLAKSFDVVVDMVMFKGEEAQNLVELLHDRVGHYLFLSTGQVYLVREDIERPFREENYHGRLIPPPKDVTFAHEEWKYGYDKRMAEDTFAEAWQNRQFPYTALRLPMVNSERDGFNRLYNYVLRLSDGGPIVAPEKPRYPLRHIYAGDVVRALKMLIDSGMGKGRAYNVSQDETVTLDEFLTLLAEIMGTRAQIVRVKRAELEAGGFLPDCSPFSERWMSELDNTRSKIELGMEYTPLPVYLEKLVRAYEETKPPKPVSYRRRHAEIQLAQKVLDQAH